MRDEIDLGAQDHGVVLWRTTVVVRLPIENLTYLNYASLKFVGGIVASKHGVLFSLLESSTCALSRSMGLAS